MNENDKLDRAPRSELSVAICLALTLVAMEGALRAQKTPLPKAADVIDQHVAAFGGKVAWDKIHNRVTKLRIVHVDMDLEDAVVEYHAKPNKRYLRIESEVFGIMEQGCDGKVVWRLSEERGPVVDRKGSGSNLGQKSVFERLLDWRKGYAKAKCTGREKVGGRLCYRVVLTPRSGEPETMFFDAKTHLLTRTKTVEVRTGVPPMPAQNTMSDYRKVDGIMIPHRIHQVSEACGTERAMILITKSIQHNVKMAKDRFELPRKVQLGIADGSAYAQRCDENGKPGCGDPGTPGKKKKDKKTSKKK